MDAILLMVVRKQSRLQEAGGRRLYIERYAPISMCVTLTLTPMYGR